MTSTGLAARGPYPKGIRRRRQIIEAAAKIFAQYGYRAGSLRNIADEVGVTSATLVSYFGQKEALLMAVLNYWRDESKSLNAGNSGLAYFESLGKLMEYNATHRGYIELFLTLATEASDPSHPARDFMVSRYENSVADVCLHLREAADKNDILPLRESEMATEAHGLIALMDGIQLQWLLNPSIDMVGLFNAHLAATLERWTGNKSSTAALIASGHTPAGAS